MKWEDFIKQVGNLPLIDTEILLAGVANPRAFKVQISRWVNSGRLIQLKRGIYLLAELYRKRGVFEPFVASVLKKPSYISLEKALEYHGLIPEAVAVYTSVTPKRSARFVTKEGIFAYRHIKKSLFWGYMSVTVNKQTAFFALPEKALLDLIYLNGMKISLDYLKELRLENTEKISLKRLFEFAKKFQKPGMLHTVGITKDYIKMSRAKEKPL